MLFLFQDSHTFNYLSKPALQCRRYAFGTNPLLDPLPPLKIKLNFFFYLQHKKCLFLDVVVVVVVVVFFITVGK